MKAKFLQFIIFALGATAALTGCNASSSSESQESITQAGSSTLVKSFSLRPNSKLLQNLDSVFFSIDQVKAEIFNADSLPWGTDVRKLTVNYTLGASGGVEIIMPSLTTGKDTVVNLVSNPTDSINFSLGRVYMRVTSANGDERVYSLKVNVHTMNADSLQWSAAVAPLPGASAATEAAKAAEQGGEYFLLTQGAGSTELLRAASPDGMWQSVGALGLPAAVDVESFCATTDALYVLGSDGTLLFSADGGQTWAEGSEGWSHLYGGFGAEVVGVKGSEWACWPGGAHGAIPAEMPVSATSTLWTFTNEWEVEPQALMLGGLKADGTPTGQAWGFDGERWMQFSNQMGTRALPAAAGMQLFPYFTYRSGKSSWWISTRQSAWIAMGGQKADGSMQADVYYSLDNGINWRKAPEAMQLPAAIKARRGASVLLCSKSFSAARAVKPVTEWDAPYVYLLGGYDASGRLYDQLWSGVINRLTFKPLI